MSSALLEHDALIGSRAPSISLVPEYGTSTGDEAIKLAKIAGLDLFPWQQEVLRHSLGERPDGNWAARAVGLVCPRQNGKNVVLVARQLAGLFLLGEKLIIHSAHRYDTSMEAFVELKDHILGTPDLAAEVRGKPSMTHGQEGIDLKSGARIRFRTRTTSGGRGFRANCVMFDEAMEFPERSHASIEFTLSAQVNPQVWYTASAVDQQTMENGIVLARIREKAIAGASGLAYFEWGLTDADIKANPDCIDDPETWARVNPSLGLTGLTVESVRASRATHGHRAFLTERLGLGDWPRGDGEPDRIIALDAWRDCADSEGTAVGDPVFAIDATPDRKWASICVAQYRSDGLPSVELHDRRGGVSWVVDAAKPFAGKATFIIDPRGPSASLIPDLEDAGIRLVEVSTEDYVRACAQFADAVHDRSLRFPPPQIELEDAIAGASARPVGDSWAWSRKNSNVDISPLVAATLAFWGLQSSGGAPGEVYSLDEAVERMYREGRGPKPPWL